MPYALKPIQVEPGVSTIVDTTLQSTPHWVNADKVRFRGGFPEKIGGWDTLMLSGNYTIQGVPRMVYSYTIKGTTYYLIGTHANLYSIVGNTLYNATPVVTTDTTINNVLRTYHATLGSAPLAASIGSSIVTVTDTGHPFVNGDVLSFSGATAFGGIGAPALNGAKSISNVTANTYQYNCGTSATSNATGGGAAVVRASRLVGVTETNTKRSGDNINVQSVASAVGGIATANMTGIRIVRNVTGSNYAFLSSAFSTASATASGGNFVYRDEIPDGTQNSTSGAGYGLGLYGVGLYGVSKTSSSATPPSIWSADKFGDFVIATQGNQTGLYSWDNTFSTIPVLVTNAPTAINYTFTSDNIVVTLGASNKSNRIKWSDQGGLTTWTATAQNQAGEDDIEGAGEFISHASVRGQNLLFTRNQTYSFRYIGKPFVWEIRVVDAGRGLIARNARVTVNGIAYWMGRNNFYMWRGGNVETIPANTGQECTIRDYVFNNIDDTNQIKSFAYYNSAFNEIWFHYPSNGALECDLIARYNVLEGTWVPDTMARTAGEYPAVLGPFPYLTNQTGTVYRHENGYNDDGVALPWTISTPFFSTNAKETLYLGGVYQDNTISTGDIQLTVNTKRYPNQIEGSSTYPITTNNANLIYRKSARYWQYALSGNTLNQSWRGGNWMELIKGGSSR